MKIESYSIQAASNWKFHSEDIKIQSVKQTVVQAESPPPAQSVSLELSEDAKNLLQKLRAAQAETDRGNRAQAGRVSDCTSSPRNLALEVRRNILEALLYRLSGKRFSFRTISLDIGASRKPQPAEQVTSGEPVALDPGFRAPQTQTILTEASFFASHYESESLRYEAKGLIRTADGRAISVDIGLNMNRELYTSVSASFAGTAAAVLQPQQQQRFTDPLVINFSGTAASLTERKFEFDLDADGRLDSISFAAEGNGFLALDKNGDGLIGDGSELFGPQSGSGFGELRAYDSDGNGWIDENDSVFSKLRVWSKDAEGADILFTLREADVGAIYLGDISTQYTLGSGAATDGMLRSTSMFLKESGGAGLISHIDLAV
ncbi:MAG: VCBS repeat-containing protein [Clostridiales Family XIII bacterium]|jgi:hypothetical protein|nr:VCBS repeat-containing protein [Clostridiales Family XIII bacterium]